MIKIYINNEALDLNVNTKVTLSKKFEDLQNPDARTAAHSYTIKVPRTKTNERIFKNVSNIFIENKFKDNTFESYITSDNITVLSGYANITAIDKDDYSMLIYDDIAYFFDIIKDKSLQDLEYGSIAIYKWQFESGGGVASRSANHYISQHNDADLTSDNTPYQFPFIYYNNFHMQDYYEESNPTREGLVNDLIQEEVFNSNSIDFPSTHYNYFIGSTYHSSGHFNYQYKEHFPPALYVISVFKKIIEDSGWSVNTSLIQGVTEFSKQFKKLILPFTGDTNIWDQGNGVTSIPVTEDPETGVYRQYYILEKFLPDMKQSDFIKQLLIMFNLYISSDVKTKTLYIEPYDNFFLSNSHANHLDSVLKNDDFKITPIKDTDRNINISYKEDSGDGASTNQLFKQSLRYINIETSDTSKNVTLEFAPTFFKKIIVINSRYFNSTAYPDSTDNNEIRIAIPYISASSASDDQGILWWNENTSDLIIDDGPAAFDPTVMNYGLEPRIIKYEGLVNMNTGNSTVDKERNLLWYYLRDTDNGSIFRMKMNQCSFFSIGDGKYPSEIDYNELIYEYVVNTSLQRDGSKLNLCFNEYPDYNINAADSKSNSVGLYSTFYLSKYANSESSNNLSVSCNISEEEYIKLIPNVPIVLNDIFYTLLNAKNYNVLTGDVILELKRKSRAVVNQTTVLFSDEIPDEIPVVHLTTTVNDIELKTYSCSINANANIDVEVAYDTNLLVYNINDNAIELEATAVIDATETIGSYNFIATRNIPYYDAYNEVWRQGQFYNVSFTLLESEVNEYTVGQVVTNLIKIEGEEFVFSYTIPIVQIYLSLVNAPTDVYELRFEIYSNISLEHDYDIDVEVYNIDNEYDTEYVTVTMLAGETSVMYDFETTRLPARYINGEWVVTDYDVTTTIVKSYPAGIYQRGGVKTYVQNIAGLQPE